MTACSDEPVKQPHLYLQQAVEAENNALLSSARQLYQKAAAVGETDAVAAVLRLSQNDTNHSELAQWLLALPLSDSQRAPFLAELGLWQQLPAAQALDYQQQWRETFAKHAQGVLHPMPRPASADSQGNCALTVQPVLSTFQSAARWQYLLQAWQQDPQLSELALCFSRPVFVDALALACTEQQGVRIQCDTKVLKKIVQQTSASHVLVLAGKGSASYNNGWLQLPQTASLPLLRHELSHIFGFMDEYPLAQAIAESECQPGRITPNVLFSKDDLPAYLDKWQISATEVELTAVQSCLHSSRQAYRVVRQDSHLQHYELPMPDLYLQLMHKQLQQPEQLMPVTYYFAFLARQEQDWPAWHQWMQLAAKAGYPPAIDALAQHKASHGIHSAR